VQLDQHEGSVHVNIPWAKNETIDCSISTYADDTANVAVADTAGALRRQATKHDRTLNEALHKPNNFFKQHKQKGGGALLREHRCNEMRRSSTSNTANRASLLHCQVLGHHRPLPRVTGTRTCSADAARQDQLVQHAWLLAEKPSQVRFECSEHVLSSHYNTAWRSDHSHKHNTTIVTRSLQSMAEHCYNEQHTLRRREEGTRHGRRHKC
jgi:hypothetical protein